ncbi:hypothetical protein EJ03DRAFT_260919, partial [Teratosphaeria nubilosa]
MGVFYETIPESLRQWILSQHVFWVATAPLSPAGHVNVSPKGGPPGEIFGLVDEKTFWYLDMSGSGNETISHLLEPRNGRITIQFNAFVGPPKIVRLWGHGRILENRSKAFADFTKLHSIKVLPGTRTIIIVDAHQVGSSCGFSVPYYDFKDYRPILDDFFATKERRYQEGKEEDRLDRYWAFKNAYSIDGLPGMPSGLVTGQKEKIEPLKKFVGAPAKPKYVYTHGFRSDQAIMLAVICFLLG